MNESIKHATFPVQEALNELNQHLLGNEHAVKLATCCVLAGGHLLLEDVPGVGKTTLAKTLANVFGLGFQRVQFTNDLMPSDLLGVSIYDQTTQAFQFKKGPVFTSALLADEINRASPKTQSALLQAMEEGEISIDGNAYALPQPFFVLATQNPVDQSGTSPLPESQLDRFLMKLSLGYPSIEFEKALLNQHRMDEKKTVNPTFTSELLVTATKAISTILCSDSIIDYVQRVMQETRLSSHFKTGLSPRAGLQWLQAARAWAFIDNRDYVLPEDVQAVAENVALHRLGSNSNEQAKIAFSDIMSSLSVT